MTEAIDSRGGPVGHGTLGRSPPPGMDIGCELKPARTEREVSRGRRAREVIHALNYPLQHRCRSEALEGGARDARSFGLAPSHEPPLILSDPSESVECRVSNTASN
jgi:hypothetical protein